MGPQVIVTGRTATRSLRLDPTMSAVSTVSWISILLPMSRCCFSPYSSSMTQTCPKYWMLTVYNFQDYGLDDPNVKDTQRLRLPRCSSDDTLVKLKAISSLSP